MLSDYRKIGDKLWRRFNARKKHQLWYYDELVKTLKNTAAPKVLVEELSRVVEELNKVVEQ